MRERFAAFLTLLSKPAVAIGGSLVIAVVAAGATWYMTSVKPQGAYVTVAAQPITEEVDVSGTVKAAQNTDLSFAAPGQVATIHVAVGDHVYQGEVLASLDGRSQAAAVEGAKANLEVQQARLASLKEGTRPEQLAIDQTAADQADVALANAVQSAYVTADDAVHVKADQLFTNPRTNNPSLSIISPDAQLSNKVQQERVSLEPLFTVWQKSVTSASSTLAVNASMSQSNLQSVNTFLGDLATLLAETSAGGSISATTLAGYQSAVNTARLNVSGALSAVTGASTADASAHGALTLAQAGATTNDLAAQQAVVDSAQAALDAANVALSQTTIVAPLSGSITMQNANMGQTVTPGVPLISLIADGKYQADAQVSESDVAKIKVGDVVQTTFSAYGTVSFPGTVTSIDPAATIANGVASYKVTMTFTDLDPRIQSGLTANMQIVTATKPSALAVPQSAIITNGTQKFVYVKGAKGPVETPVVTGIESANGMTEITTGLSAGMNVLTFGSTGIN